MGLSVIKYNEKQTVMALLIMLIKLFKNNNDQLISSIPSFLSNGMHSNRREKGNPYRDRLK